MTKNQMIALYIKLTVNDKERKELREANKKAETDYQKATDYLKSIGLTATFEVVNENPNFDSKEKFNFLVSLSSTGNTKHSFHFSQSHKKPMQRGYQEYLRDLLKVQNQYPDLFSLLNSLTMDASALDNTFDDWCNEYGYDSDSIKAKTIYDLCIKQAIECKSLFDAEEVQAYLESHGLN